MYNNAHPEKSDFDVEEHKHRFKEIMQTKRHNEWKDPLDVMKKRKTRKDQDVSMRQCNLISEENEQHNKMDADIYFEGAAEYMAKCGSFEREDDEFRRMNVNQKVHLEIDRIHITQQRTGRNGQTSI